MELPGNGARFRHIAVIFRQETANLRNCPVPVVAGDCSQECRPSSPSF